MSLENSDIYEQEHENPRKPPAAIFKEGPKS